MIHVRHLSWLLSSAGGGIPPVVFALAAAQRKIGLDARALGVADGAEETVSKLGVPCEEYQPWGPRALGFSPGLSRALRASSPDLLHLHGLFTWPSHVARSWRKSSDRPVVVSPHGMLEPWAISNSVWKKRIFSALVEDDNLGGASCLHALCGAEAENLRRLGLRNPVAVIPNGVDVVGLATAPGRMAFDLAFPAAVGRPFVIFLGRIHPKKGLLHLVEAWAKVTAEVRQGGEDWLLVVAGPDQGGHLEQVRSRARALDLERDLLFTGPLQDDAKWSTLSAAEAFVLPSFSEGFSVAVLEAMACRLPVLLSKQCNFDVEAIGAGVLCEPTVASVTNQLRHIISLGRCSRRTLGERGRDEVERNYSWPMVAQRTEKLYAWLLGGGPLPWFVEMP